MNIGTRSLLFGVHQFLWHPLTVALAWRKLYRRWPDLTECLAIFFHDWGYWGCPNIDGQEGKLHPERSAKIVRRVARWFTWADAEPNWCSTLVLFHSRDYVKRYVAPIQNSEAVRETVMKLCWPDKYSVNYEPFWFFRLRARLSGEMAEFKANAIRTGYLRPDGTDREWFAFYLNKVNNLPEIKKLLNDQ